MLTPPLFFPHSGMKNISGGEVAKAFSASEWLLKGLGSAGEVAMGRDVWPASWEVCAEAGFIFF